MALVHEDGTGKSDAESLASVAAADARAAALGNAAWPVLTTAVKEQRLRKATIFMLQTYRGRWAGLRVHQTQAQDWPRSWVEVDGFAVASDIVPSEVVNACIDLAFNTDIDNLNPDLDRAIIREKVGPLETEYSPHSPQATRYRAIDMALAPYLTGSSAMARLVRT